MASTTSPDPLAQMVARQIARRGVRDERVLEAMRTIPRNAFLAPETAAFAHEDSPLPIGCGQTISQPYIVALMAEAARIGPQDCVLDVGTGSGYGAAVLAALARRVVSVERHAPLAQTARERLRQLGIDNVTVRVGDGTRGAPQDAPFDAIVVAAAPETIPEPLKDQLASGGRLVIPVGPPGLQRLLRLTRTGPDTFRTDDLGAVAFVPLVADPPAQGDAEQDPPDASPVASPAAPSTGDLTQVIEPLPPLEDTAFAATFDRFAQARVVLLGEASHGTSEFYRARAAITRRLVERHGFTIVAAEADWPDAMAVNRFVRGEAPATGIAAFARFPRWMWRNEEMAALWRWMHEYNRALAPDARVGFYGLDLYNLDASVRTVLSYLDKHDPPAAALARERYGCILPFREAPASYGRLVSSRGLEACEEAVTAMLADMLARQEHQREREDPLFDATESARLVASAERFYRALYRASAESWNLRDTHMFQTLDALLGAHPTGKAVVWAHNSHVGDARATELGTRQGELNLGQLCREAFGEEVRLIGFGTHTGTVAAAAHWDGPMQVMEVPPSLPNSCERISHEAGAPRFLLETCRAPHSLARPRLQRFIGVVYRPDTERWSHYVEACLARQFDAWVWFDRTRALTPLSPAAGGGPDETFPFGL